MKHEDFFYSNIQIRSDFESKLISSLEKLNDKWTEWPQGQTIMYDTKNEASALEMIDNPVIDNHTTLFKDCYAFLEQGMPLPASLEGTIRFLKLPAGSSLGSHYDNPKCAIIFHLNESDPLSFYDETNSKIFESRYKFALINTAIKHGVEATSIDRVWFKISISRFSYFQMRELLYARGLLLY
jgi:hypothetical protein